MLHTSDVHLGEDYLGDSQRRRQRAHHTLEAIVSLALREKADVVIVAGDLFEHNRIKADVADFACQQLRRLRGPAIILPGNHDCLAPDSVYLRIDLPRLCPNIKVFTAPQGETFSFPGLDLEVWGKPITSYGGDLRPLSGMPPRGKMRWQVAVAHGYCAKLLPATKAHASFPISEEEIATSCRDYVALGHWATFTCICDGPVKAYYSGSPSLGKRVAIVDFEDKTGVQVMASTLEV